MGWFDRRGPAGHGADAVPEVDPVEAARLVGEGALLVDVRRTDEWLAGRAPAARHVPMDDLGRRLDELPLDRTIVAVCRSGRRSGFVTEQLRTLGYEVVNLQGGMQAWAGAGYPVVASGGRVGRVV